MCMFDWQSIEASFKAMEVNRPGIVGGPNS